VRASETKWKPWLREREREREKWYREMVTEIHELRNINKYMHLKGIQNET
jgi:hypothetical protein